MPAHNSATGENKGQGKKILKADREKKTPFSKDQ